MTDMGRPTRITRARHDEENPYFLHSRATAQDTTLSWEARGVLSYLLSKPDDWIAQVADLQQGCGRDRVYRILKELRQAGYLTLEERPKAQGQYVGVGYVLHERPVPLPEKPDTVQPDTAKPELTYKRALQNKENSESLVVAKATTVTPTPPENHSISYGVSVYHYVLAGATKTVCGRQPGAGKFSAKKTECAACRRLLDDGPMLLALAELCYGPGATLTDTSIGDLTKTLNDIRVSNPTRDLILVTFQDWWKANTWQGRDKGQRPKPAEIRAEWSRFTAYLSQQHKSEPKTEGNAIVYDVGGMVVRGWIR